MSQSLSVFCEAKLKQKQANMHKLMGNAHSQTNVSRNWKEMREHWKTLSFKEVYEIYARTSNLLIKYSHKGVRLLSGSFFLFITCSSLHEMMAEDWVHLKLEMRLQLGVLQCILAVLEDAKV